MKKIFINLPNFSSTAHFLLSNLLFGNDYFFVFLKDEEDAQQAFNEISQIKNLLFENIPIQPVLFISDKQERLKAASIVYSNSKPKIIILDEKSTIEEMPSKASWEKNSFEIKVGTKISRTKLAEILYSNGYERVSFVEKPGEFALRGSVVDFFSATSQFPERIYLSEKVENIKTFDITTQQTLNFLSETKIFPMKDKGIKIFEIKGRKSAIFFQDTSIANYIKEFDTIYKTTFEEGFCEIQCTYLANIKYNYNKFLISKDLSRLNKDGYTIIISCLNQRETAALEDFFISQKLPPAKIVYSHLQEGFSVKKEKLAILTFRELFSKYDFPQGRLNIPRVAHFKFSDLNRGDYLVHEDFGIGKYLGIRKISETTSNGEIRETECLEIEYARGDKLLVPLYEFKRVQKFIGCEGKKPKLSHMDTKTWGEVKNRVKKEVESIAKELLAMEAKRMATKTKPLNFSIEEQAFENAFPYEETQDQRKAIIETLSDLEKSVPMNRVIVGDVGFGKTEVAMRAAFRAVINAAQVCVLCPTTILTEQHYRTFLKRFEGFPVNIASLSRLTKPSEAKKIKAMTASGEIDILIGTHKVLQKSTKFKNLGLLIVDEEHKFGVKDKEKLKTTISAVHYLTMSATPIPRTLYQSISSIRAMSVIESPPIGRLPVHTKIEPYSDSQVHKAVYFELDRGGQVYYVYNKVESIESKKAKLEKILPAARIAFIHGQMSSSKIEETMEKFLQKDYDVLIASTIIESGIDIPSVNTLIIENAHALGLAQLYQLRGRIGREKQKAYCYLFYPSLLPADAISSDAIKRLAALGEFSELGSGFRLAMRDLEIRGAGELLGVRQHGFLNSVGLEMYVKLLNGEINKLKGHKEQEKTETSIDLDIPAYIPQDYIQDEMERINYYKKLLNAQPEQVDKILTQLRDISGETPQPLKNLAEIIKLKKMLSIMSVRSITQKADKLEVMFERGASISTEQILCWQKRFPQIRFLKNPAGDGFCIPAGKNVLSLIKSLFFT